jgi:intracellular sulfur oxidation DsrE/DsrF family protein
MYNKLIVLLFTLSASFVSAQVNKLENIGEQRQHRIVFQLSTNDTLAHKALMKQISNITTVAPDTKIEVVCHGPGLEILVKGKTTVQDKIANFTEKGISFLACEFSMKERNVSKEKIILEAGFIKAGIIEIVSKQEQGWSYIKSGF